MYAATYKDFIFGMLFLKRCSDIFEADYEKIVQRKTYQGLQIREAKSQYGENPIKSSLIGSPKMTEKKSGKILLLLKDNPALFIPDFLKR